MVYKEEGSNLKECEVNGASCFLKNSTLVERMIITLAELEKLIFFYKAHELGGCGGWYHL